MAKNAVAKLQQTLLIDFLFCYTYSYELEVE